MLSRVIAAAYNERPLSTTFGSLPLCGKAAVYAVTIPAYSVRPEPVEGPLSERDRLAFCNGASTAPDQVRGERVWGNRAWQQTPLAKRCQLRFLPVQIGPRHLFAGCLQLAARRIDITPARGADRC